MARNFCIKLNYHGYSLIFLILSFLGVLYRKKYIENDLKKDKYVFVHIDFVVASSSNFKNNEYLILHSVRCLYIFQY